MKSSELGQQYLVRNYDSIQNSNTRRRLDNWLGISPLRRQLGTAASSVNDLLTVAIQETEATGSSLCNCKETMPPAQETSGAVPEGR